MLRSSLTLAFAIGSLAIATPSHAVIFQFYEGNNCTQDSLGSLDVDKLVDDNETIVALNLANPSARAMALLNPAFLPALLRGGWNDEARSVRIISNWRVVREPRTARLLVADSPSGSTNDDWTVIRVTDATQIPESGLCIGSFERPFNRSGVTVELHPHNGLDGKVSHLELRCDTACRRDLTPDLNAPRMRPGPTVRLPRPAN